MKKTLTVNISGMAFSIDEDAYGMLESYLHDIERRLRVHESDSETVKDIENRVMEIFQEKTNGIQSVVSIELVKHVISVIGSPSIFGDAPPSSSSARNYSETTTTPRTMTNRLMRHPNEKIIGGVCGGLAAYLGLDISIVRIVSIILAICSVGTAAILYIVLWVVVPEAETQQDIDFMNDRLKRYNKNK